MDQKGSDNLDYNNPPIPVLLGSSRTITSENKSTTTKSNNITKPKTKQIRKHSKTGCTLCKLRKIKCDEQHPNCSNCMKRGLQCIYQDPALRKSKKKLFTNNNNNTSIQIINSPSFNNLIPINNNLFTIPTNNQINSNNSIPILNTTNHLYSNTIIDDSISTTPIPIPLVSQNVPITTTTTTNTTTNTTTTTTTIATPLIEVDSPPPVLHELPPFESKGAPPTAITETLLEINNLPKDQVLRELENEVGHGGSLSRKGANYLMTLFPGSSVKTESGRFVLSSQDADDYGKYYFSSGNHNDGKKEKIDDDESNSNSNTEDIDDDTTTLIHRLSPLDIILKRVHELKLYSQINFEFVEYFTTQYYAKLSSNFQIQKTWLSVFGLGSNYKHMMHISLAMVALDFYYNASRMYIEQNFKKNLNSNSNSNNNNKKKNIQFKIPTQKLLEDRNGYLKLAEFHQTKSLKFFQESISSRNSTFESSITNITSALLQVLYCLFSPNYKISQGILFNLGSGLGAVYRSGKSNLSEKNAVQMSVYKVAHHYDLSTLPNVKFSQIYFPHYLNDLLELQDFEINDNIYSNNLQISEVKSNQQRLSENLQHYQSFISDLYTAYAQVYNNVVPESDLVPIIIRFVVDCKKELGSLLLEKDPRTLIIVAHFFQLISSMVNPKFASQDVFIDELENIENNLNDYWKPWLNCPKLTILNLSKFDLDINYDINSNDLYDHYPDIY